MDAKTDKYEQWIAERIAEAYNGEAWRTMGRCASEVRLMAQTFPELTIVRGHVQAVFSTGVHKRAHWWLTRADGTIVDPTRGQYTGPVLAYEPYQAGDPIRLGVCANCGKEIWGSPSAGVGTVCSTECHREYAAYLQGTPRYDPDPEAL